MKLSTKYLKITLNIVSVIVGLLLCIYLLPKLLVFFMPFVIAAVIALIANPVVKFLEKRVRIVRKAGTAVVIVLVIALVVFMLYIIIAKLIEELVGFAGSAPLLWKNTSRTITQMMGVYDVYFNKLPDGVQNWLGDLSVTTSDSLNNWIHNMGTPIGEMAAKVASNLPLTIVGIIMCILASYCFLADKDYLVKSLNRILPSSIINRWNLVYGTMKDAVGGYFKAQLKIMAVVYVILLVGLLILGRSYALLIALLIAFLDFLPFFGAGAVMWPWAVIAFFSTDYKLAIGLMITWGVAQLVRQLIQPKLLGDSIGLKPIPTLIILYIGFRVAGAIGLIISVPVGMIVINLYKAGIFSNFIYSIKILFKDMSNFRRFSRKELLLEGVLDDSEDYYEDKDSSET